MRKVKQEIHCHECNNYVQFEIDADLDGNHVFKCPKCGHEHCRVVRKGEITGERWESRNGAQTWGTFQAVVVGWSTTSNYTYSTGTDTCYTDEGTGGLSFLRASWYDSGTGGY